MELIFNTEDWERKTRELDGAYDQMPFALSRALNDAAIETRHKLVDETWPSSITERNKSFIGAALHINFSDKHNLRVEIVDRLNRASLRKHAEGGTKYPRGSKLAVPSPNVSVGPHGWRISQRPANLVNKIVIGNKIYQYQGKGKNRKLVLMFTLVPSVHIKKDVPFYDDFNQSMRDATVKSFPARMMQAMRTRR